MKAPLGAQDVAYKDPNATVMGTRTAASLFLDRFAVFVLRARGSRDIPSTLGLREGMEGALRYADANPSRKKKVAVRVPITVALGSL